MNLLNILLIGGLSICLGVTQLNAQNVTIPDSNFKAYLVGDSNINTNGDTEIQISEASVFTGMINCSFKSIADLTGIEAFVALKFLSCYNNALTSLDLSQNISLINLQCYSNTLTNLDLSQNTSLIYLYCYDNGLTNLNISQNVNLTTLFAYNNSLTSLDVT